MVNHPLFVFMVMLARFQQVIGGLISGVGGWGALSIIKAKVTGTLEVPVTCFNRGGDSGEGEALLFSGFSDNDIMFQSRGRFGGGGGQRNLLVKHG